MPGLGRLYIPDARDSMHTIRALGAVPSVRDYRYWSQNGWWGDQGEYPHCVAFAWAHCMADSPRKMQPDPPFNPAELYRRAQIIDQWPGEDYDGTSVRAGAAVLKEQRIIDSYRWAWDFDTVLNTVLDHGPVVVGTNWYEGMMRTDQDGYIRPDGAVLGGHAWLINGASRARDAVRMKNSWSRYWGATAAKRLAGTAGFAWIKFSDMARLLEEDGEACYVG